MNAAIFNGKASMTSVEIAELVGSRHDKVKQSIERLAERRIIQLPPMGISENINGLGLTQKVSIIFSKVNEANATASLSSHSFVPNSQPAW